MLESKRKFRRFNLPLGVKFRPTYGAKDYADGMVTNLSAEGLGLDANDFKFILCENLELLVDVPGNGNPASLFGDISWKKQTGKQCMAGIKFRMKDKNMLKDSIEKILAASDIPADTIYHKDRGYITKQAAAGFSRPERSIADKTLPPLPNKLGFIKQYYENGARCKVTFRLLREVVNNGQHVTIAGDFNNWDVSQSPMTRLKNGDFVITIDVYSNREYRFRYLIDGQRWENDWYADKFAPNNYGSKDSILIV